MNQDKGAGQPRERLSCGASGGGGQRVGVGTVSAWAGSQMAWGATPGVPVPTGSGGVVPWASQAAFVASVSSPEKEGSESASRDVGRRTEDRPRGGGDSLALLGFAGPEPAPTPPRPSCTAVLCPRSPQTRPTSGGGGFRPDNSLSLTFSTSPFRKKETAKMLRAETLTGSSKVPPGGC